MFDILYAGIEGIYSMPHQRERTITPVLLKRMKLWPVLGIIGQRQCGKSTLLREILTRYIRMNYTTMDSENFRKRAEHSPESFSEPEPGKVNVIDEVQKVPSLFDAVKLHVDQKRRPGTFILSGSTEFSSLTGIRESLTGRIGILNLYPFNLSEIHSKKFGKYFIKPGKYSAQVSLTEFDRKITSGGMPGFFYLHSKEEYSAAAQLWIETTSYRDLGRVLKKNFDGDLALSILTELAQTEFPTASEIGSRLEKDPRIILRYLEGFTKILVLKRITPHLKGVGKHHYVIFDSGLATFLGASRKAALRSHVLVEALSFFEASGLNHPQVEYYRSEKKSYIPLIFSWKNERKTCAVQISDREVPSLGEVKSLESLSLRLQMPMRTLVLSQAQHSYVEKGVEFHPLRG